MLNSHIPHLLPPTSYQGGKVRIASELIKHIRVPDDFLFYDLCCGSGAVTLCMIENGMDPKSICMIDSGPYGHFWQAIANGSFEMSRFLHFCDQIPKDKNRIPEYLKELSAQPCRIEDVPYIFLLLQAGSFGAKAITWSGSKWGNTSFRSFWQPKEGCNRKSVVNPMMPMPGTLQQRVQKIIRYTKGIKAICSSIEEVVLPSNCVCYIDPPYQATTGYLDDIKVVDFACRTNRKCYVSESVPLGSKAILISQGRKKGRINGKIRGTGVAEYLSIFEISS